MGRRRCLRLRRQCHLFSDRGSHRAASPRVPDGKPAGGRGVGCCRYSGGEPHGERRNALWDQSGRHAGRRDPVARRSGTSRLRDSDANDGEQLQSDRSGARSRRLLSDCAFDRRAVRALRRRCCPLRPAGESARENALVQIPELQHHGRRRRGSVHMRRLFLQCPGPASHESDCDLTRERLPA